MEPMGLTLLRKRRKRRMQVILAIVVIIINMMYMMLLSFGVAFHELNSLNYRKRGKKRRRLDNSNALNTHIDVVGCKSKLGVDEAESSNDNPPEMPPRLKKARKENTPKGKEKLKTPEFMDLDFIETMSAKFSGFMDEMNNHLGTIANAWSSTQQHEQAMMISEERIIGRKESLVPELASLPGLSGSQVLTAAKLLSANQSDMDLFFATSDVEWKKAFVLELLNE